jgi:hypothetical protein
MTSQADAMETTIPKGRTLRIQDGEGLELNVVAGCLWVTYEHDTVDTVLDPSDTLRVSRNGLTLVHALTEVQLRIAYPVEAGAPSLTLGGGYREVGRSVARSIFAEWLSGMRGRIAGGARGRSHHDQRGHGHPLNAQRIDTARGVRTMSDDQLYANVLERRDPTPEEIRWYVQQGARLRSEALHGVLHRAAAWVGGGTLGEPEPSRGYWSARHPRAA